jgi:hypothetical protein
VTASCLYVNSKGQPWRKHSYSAGNLWDNCQYFYYLQKVLGYKQKESYARFAFGRALEESIQFFCEHNGLDSVDDFVRRWAIYKDNGEFSYTATEKNWATCNEIGRDMIRLLQVQIPKLPIYTNGRSIFQREYEREVFPGDKNYGGIFDAGRIDIISYAEPGHPMLPKIEWKSENGLYRPIVIDIKTAAQELAEQPGIVSFDAQLKRYSSLTGIKDVAMLWFVKKALGLKKGYNVTMLETTGSFLAGEEAVIAKLEDNFVWVVKTDFMVDEMDKVKKQGKPEDEEQIAHNWLNQHGAKVKLTDVTKQKLQFSSGVVSPAEAEDAGRTAARQIIEIVNACKTGVYTRNYGIRYPRDDRNNPYFRAFVLQDEMFKKQNFTKVDEESFDDLFKEETE